MGQGYMGKVLFVDLSTGDTRVQIIPDKIYQNYLSGMGLSAYLLYGRIPGDANPLGPDNILGFVSGILTGTGSLFAGRWMVVAKSPLTGTWGDANCGGNFAPAIKRCGYDGIFISGISPKPVLLYIDQKKVEIRSAAHLWGKDTIETEKDLSQPINGRKPRVACIGPAGEKLSLISGIVNDGGRLAARSGLGAVMGSKRLKALVLNGEQRIMPYDRKEIHRLSRQCNEAVQYQPPFASGSMIAYMGKLMRVMPAQMEMDGMLYKIMLKKWGTISMNQMSVEMGDAPIKNWKGTNEDFDTDRSAPTNPDIFSKSVVAKYYCYACPLGCGGICLEKKDGNTFHRPEYETVLSLGGLLLNEDTDSIFYLNELLNRAGMDTISTGATVAFAIECFENNILTKKATDGLELTWGNTRSIVALVEKMVRREGIGDLLADGSLKAAQKLGQDAIQYAIQAGGQELGMHDSRFDPGFAVHYSAEATPGRHTIGSQLYYEMFRLWTKIKTLPDPELIYLKDRKFEPDRQKAIASAACSKFMNVINGAGCCLFGAFMGPERMPVFEWLNAATGCKKSPESYLDIGGRVQTLKQAFNIKHGIEPGKVKINPRALGHPPQTRGANKGRRIPLDQLRQDYWEQLGWDRKTGKPTLASLKKLEI